MLEWVNTTLPDKEVDDIPDSILEKGESRFKAALIRLGVSNEDIPTENDEHDLVKNSAFAFALDLLCKTRIITTANGNVLQERFGDVSYQYQKSNPLFFFATGASESFLRLLPNETLRQQGYFYAIAYSRYLFHKQTGDDGFATPTVVRDNSSRGYGWDRKTDSYSDDVRYGDDMYRWGE